VLDWLRNLLGGNTPPTPTRPGSAEHARTVLAQAFEAYRLARRDRPREHYQPHGFSGDSAILGSHDLMNRRTRDLVRNTAQAKRIISAIVDLVVGTGMRTYAWPFAPSELFEIVTELETLQAGNLGPRLAFALESDDLFDEWFNDPQQFDAEGRLSGPEVQRMLLQESALVGDGLLVRTFPKKSSIVPLAYQLFEREQLDESQDRPAAPGRNAIVGGREFDAGNRVVAYHLYTDHPHDAFGTGASALLGAGRVLAVGGGRVRIPAERVIDLALFSRPSASGGASWLDACGQSIWDRDSFMESEIRSAALDAVFALIAHLEDAEQHGAMGLADGLADGDEYGNREYKVGHSPIAAIMGTNEKLEMVRSERPNKDAPHFMGLLDHDIAGATPLSYYSLTGNYSATNFSSTRAAKLDEDLHIRPLQAWFATHVALPIRRQFNLLAAAGGKFQSITPAEFRASQRTYQRFDAIGVGRDLLDPRNEGEARIARLRAGLATYKEEQARAGKHWIRELMQLAVERKIADLFGVVLDFSNGGSPPAESAKEETRDEQDDRETKESTRAAK